MGLLVLKSIRSVTEPGFPVFISKGHGQTPSSWKAEVTCSKTAFASTASLLETPRGTIKLYERRNFLFFFLPYSVSNNLHFTTIRQPSPRTHGHLAFFSEFERGVFCMLEDTLAPRPQRRIHGHCPHQWKALGKSNLLTTEIKPSSRSCCRMRSKKSRVSGIFPPFSPTFGQPEMHCHPSNIDQEIVNSTDLRKCESLGAKCALFRQKLKNEAPSQIPPPVGLGCEEE